MRFCTIRSKKIITYACTIWMLSPAYDGLYYTPGMGCTGTTASVPRTSALVVAGVGGVGLENEPITRDFISHTSINYFSLIQTDTLDICPEMNIYCCYEQCDQYYYDPYFGSILTTIIITWIQFIYPDDWSGNQVVHHGLDERRVLGIWGAWNSLC